MKKIIIIPVIILLLALVGCQKDYLNLDPLDRVTEAAYFNKPEHFLYASNKLYEGMVSLKPTKAPGISDNSYNSNVGDFMDFGSDLIASPNDEGRGSNNSSDIDKYWTNTYVYLRDINILLKKADEYPGDASDISQYVATAYFFRAWQHFFLLQRFGGVPIVTSVLDLESPELFGPRNSRYEVVDQIIADLNVAIEGLPTEQNIGSSDKGKISKWGAEAFKAKVLLYEATWEKYVGTTTDFTGSGGPTGSSANYFGQVVQLCKDVMDNGGYELWNYNSQLDNYSMRYLFNLEDSGSNPAGLDKSSNKEFIIQSIYDYELRKGMTNISLAVDHYYSPDRKLLDMFLCSDGLPIDKSPLFQGYNKTSDEFTNRDYRMNAYFNASVPADGSVGLGTKSPGEGKGVRCNKFHTISPSYRADNDESFNFPHLRLAEVYLMYTEALMERDGAISDADLNVSINKVRARSGVAPLTNAFVSANGLNMMDEIRRERDIELLAENSRFNDLKRWGMAEDELNKPILGAVIEGTQYEGNANLYNPLDFVYGTTPYQTAEGIRETLVLDPAANRNFTRKNYLFPIPQNQINLNPALVQNPNW